MKFNTVEELVEDMRQGKMVVIMDDDGPKSGGEVMMAAEHVRPENINFMATHARGLVCLTLTEARCQQLDLPLMVRSSHLQNTTKFTLSIEAAEGVTTGISAADRAQTIHAAIAQNASSRSLVQPGHIFPLQAQPGGVLSRAGHTEAGCDLAGLAGCEPAAASAEIMNADGSMARGADLAEFAEAHQLKIGTIADLIHYRCLTEKTIVLEKTHQAKTRFGEFQLSSFKDTVSGDYHFALHQGTIDPQQTALVRVHVLDGVRDILALQRKQDQFVPWMFHDALKAINEEGAGVAVLICYNQTNQDMEAQIDQLITGSTSYQLPKDRAYRQVGTGAQILRELGVHKMRLMSAPLNFSAISGFDLEVVDVMANPEGEH